CILPRAASRSRGGLTGGGSSDLGSLPLPHEQSHRGARRPSRSSVASIRAASAVAPRSPAPRRAPGLPSPSMIARFGRRRGLSRARGPASPSSPQGRAPPPRSPDEFGLG